MYKVVIGLEVHCELKTKSKNFSGSPNIYSTTPNVNVLPVDLGLPGILPVVNKEACHKAIKTALALNCSVPDEIMFDRKNYYYPDLPKGYQISGDYITNSKNIDSPEVGDIRISYTYSPDKNISVLAKQKNNTFDYYVTKNKSKVNITLSGIKTGSEIIDGFDKTNYVRNNLFVLASLIFITIGIICFLRKKE